LQALIRANQLALKALSVQPDLVIDYLASFLNRLTRRTGDRISAPRKARSTRWPPI
jgi:hypothetical protein